MTDPNLQGDAREVSAWNAWWRDAAHIPSMQTLPEAFAAGHRMALAASDADTSARYRAALQFIAAGTGNDAEVARHALGALLTEEKQG